MLRALLSGALKIRFALWAVEMALPSESDLTSRFRSGLLGVLAAVAGGVLMALLGVASILGAGFALYHLGDMTAMQAIATTFGACLAVAIGLFMIGRAKMEKAFGTFNHRTLDTRIPGDDAIKELLNGFVEGLVEDTPPPAKAARQNREENKAFARSRAA